MNQTKEVFIKIDIDSDLNIENEEDIKDLINNNCYNEIRVI